MGRHRKHKDMIVSRGDKRGRAYQPVGSRAIFDDTGGPSVPPVVPRKSEPRHPANSPVRKAQ